MAKFKVRDGFYLHGIGADPIGPQEIVELTDEQAAAHAHKIEEVAASKPVKGKASAD